MALTLTPESSNIAGYEYDPKSMVLTVQFKSGGTTYTYAGVPQKTVDEFAASKSKGGFLSSRIKGIHQHTKVK